MIEWNVSPDLIRLGPLTLRWYGALFALSFFLGHWIIQKIFVLEKIPAEKADRYLVYIVVSTIISARLGHTLFYQPEIYLRDPVRILKVWEGGLASHGAAIGMTLAIWIFANRHRLGFLWLLDRTSIAVSLAGSLVRLGNLFNSEIIGKPTQVPWAFKFDRLDGVPRHPAQLYESISYFLVFLILGRLYRNPRARSSPGLSFGVFLFLVFGTRFLIEFLKEPQVSFEATLPLNMGQLLSVPLIIGGAMLIWRSGYFGSRERSS